jgi:hypothetical protein
VIPASATVGEARRRFTLGGHGAYPIVDEQRALVGIVTRGDVLGDEGPDDDDLLAEVATRQVVTVAPRDAAQRALRVMVEESVEHVPVVDGEGALVGICTRTDLLEVRRGQLDLERLQRGVTPLRRGAASACVRRLPLVLLTPRSGSTLPDRGCGMPAPRSSGSRSTSSSTQPQRSAV